MSATDASQQANRAGMDPKRLVVIAYLVFAIIIGMFLGHLLGMLFAQLRFTDGELVEGSGITYTTGLGFLVAISAAGYCWANPKVRNLATETANELMRVTWPSWEETRVSTAAVVVASLVASIILFGIDTLSYKVMVDWLPMIWGKL